MGHPGLAMWWLAALHALRVLVCTKLGLCQSGSDRQLVYTSFLLTVGGQELVLVFPSIFFCAGGAAFLGLALVLRS